MHLFILLDVFQASGFEKKGYMNYSSTLRHVAGAFFFFFLKMRERDGRIKLYNNHTTIGVNSRRKAFLRACG